MIQQACLNLQLDTSMTAKEQDMSKHLENGGRAVIEDDCVVIRYPFAAFQSALDGSWGMNKIVLRDRFNASQREARS